MNKRGQQITISHKYNRSENKLYKKKGSAILPYKKMNET